MATEAAVQTNCPTCGAKITQQHLSLCAYCGAPLAIGGQPRKQDRATLRRLAKMSEHASYEAAMAWDPPRAPHVRRAQARRRVGIALSAAGLALILLGVTTSGWASLPVIGAALLAIGVVRIVQNTHAVRADAGLELTKRPAIVVHRRSETEERGRGRTNYFFELLFADGTSGEFCYPGRGANHDPLVPGNTGIAYTRGNELLAFRSIRV